MSTNYKQINKENIYYLYLNPTRLDLGPTYLYRIENQGTRSSVLKSDV